MSEAIEKVDQHFPEIKAAGERIGIIQDLFSTLMQEGVHYGTIPGCGNKPVLLKPGADLIAATLKLRPEYDVIATELASGHVAYLCKCALFEITSERKVSAGVGEASTMESKYRYRWVTIADKKRWPDKEEGRLLKAEGRGKWRPLEKDRSGRVVQWAWSVKAENDNPYDVRNTVLKIAKKRAFVDACITVAAASDIFTQDLEDLVSNGIIEIPSESVERITEEVDAPTMQMTKSKIVEEKAPTKEEMEGAAKGRNEKKPDMTVDLKEPDFDKIIIIPPLKGVNAEKGEPKRKRGRPRKQAQSESVEKDKPKRKRGRPRKKPQAEYAKEVTPEPTPEPEEEQSVFEITESIEMAIAEAGDADTLRCLYAAQYEIYQDHDALIPLKELILEKMRTIQ